uniref:CPK17 protein n=1 Tax=Fopius arisanus TaxID=64838 RepID=A0A0C9RVS9_9HYME
MFNWMFSSKINSDYFSWLFSFYEQIHRDVNVLIDGVNKNWIERIIPWINQPDEADWQMFAFPILTLMVIIFITIMTVKWLQAFPSDPRNFVEPADNEDQMIMEYLEFVPTPLEINRIIKERILHFDAENYNQLYILPLGFNTVGNSSLQINEIIDTIDSLDDDELEFKNILDEIIDKIVAHVENNSKGTTKLEDSSLSQRPCKNNSRIPLLKSRQGQTTPSV